MNPLASREVVDDTNLSDSPEDDIEITPERIAKVDLDIAEDALDNRRCSMAEDALNRVAGLYRLLCLPNTSRRYRELSRRAAYAALGELPEDDATEPTIPMDGMFTKG